MPTVSGQATGPDEIAVMGESQLFEGVRGISHAGDSHGAVVGVNDNATDTAGPGVYGKSRGTGVWGASETWMGVYGKSTSTTGGAGVMGEGDPAPGVIGKSTTWIGVYGETAGIQNSPAGVWGEHKGAGIGVKAISNGGIGLAASSQGREAVYAETNSTTTAAVAGWNRNPDGTGAAIYGEKAGTVGFAGFFKGNVYVSGDITVGGDVILSNADCAEHFDVAETDPVEPGTVMVLGEHGALQRSHQAYDKRVAGVVSGAGEYRPGIVLDKQPTSVHRSPIALLGKVSCKVDASSAAIEVGDLLTTSDMPGHAMKAVDPVQAFGAVIGKALRPLHAGHGLIPILIALQ